MARKKESKQKDQKPKVNKELEGMEIKIDSFGEIRNSLSIDKINEFLNKNVDDKKLRDRDDLDEIKNRESDEEE
ncbi:hypothetical protein EV198_2786 [Roseivirga ehrenbergii]|uniref:Uncharacterized protein n=1 Tax=Roseivirga ehrenbergii (strain DSM 102268 / JCM 13514 / KCTC 12282 / NCIMB 14502 / KMM 6017) TaxID=279360 RepID=A0A150XTS7_ROSEK|nr:hypothetical protein [Roseivirga ehrenbergii]KYG82168.1 hypothetical protein MB14_01865 [Roseivirga ehrenbergii]TCL01994.1 hypothetical protein EV198_2786 [Roseivirga ehrenbergii]